MAAKIDIKATKTFKNLIKPKCWKYWEENYWIAQDKCGEIYAFSVKPELHKNYNKDKSASVWLIEFIRHPAFFLCNPIKGKYITTYAHSLAQLGKDNFYLDTRGRLRVESQDLPELLKEQA